MYYYRVLPRHRNIYDLSSVAKFHLWQELIEECVTIFCGKAAKGEGEHIYEVRLIAVDPKAVST
jgi:hypothetical protein